MRIKFAKCNKGVAYVKDKYYSPFMQDEKRQFTPVKCLVALGSNLTLGKVTPLETLKKSLRLCEAESLKIHARSSWHSAPAFPAGSGPDYVNAAIMIETDLPPQELLAVLHSIEAKLGRTRENRWESRICDLDLLAYGETICPNKLTYGKWHDLSLTEQQTLAPDELILPHPRMQDRAFVLVPLQQIAPDWRHPVLDQTVTEMLNALPENERAEIKPLAT